MIEDPDRDRERRWPWYAIGALALALVAVLAYLVLSGVLATDKKQVPRVTGKQLVEARAVMERAGFEVETERVQSEQPFDQVLDQDPNAGEEAEAARRSRSRSPAGQERCSCRQSNGSPRHRPCATCRRRASR